MNGNPSVFIDRPVGIPAARGAVPFATSASDKCWYVYGRRQAVPAPADFFVFTECMKFSAMMNKALLLVGSLTMAA